MARYLFVAPSAYPEGGVATWLGYILPGLEALGHEAYLGLVNGAHHCVEKYLKVFPYHRVIPITNETGTKIGRVKTLVNVFKTLEPDVVCSVNIPDVYLAASRLKKQSSDVPHIVMAIHGLELAMLQDASRYRQLIDGFVGTNQLTCQMLSEISQVSKNKIFYAPCGVPESKVVHQHKHSPVLRILYSGRLDQQQKRAHDIPAIISELERKNIKFIFRLAGDGPELESLRQQLRVQIDSGQVEILGWLSSSDLYSQYQWADALLITSQWETGPIVAWEALLNEAALITSDYIGRKAENTLIHLHNCLVYPIGDVGGAARMIEMLSDTDLRNTIVKNGRALVKSRYNIKNSIEKFEQAMSTIFSNRKSVDIVDLPIANSGRLDKFLGCELADLFRQMFGNSIRHQDGGSEWSHTHSNPSEAELNRYQSYLCKMNEAI